jgi:hypothetical protein
MAPDRLEILCCESFRPEEASLSRSFGSIFFVLAELAPLFGFSIAFWLRDLHFISLIPTKGIPPWRLIEIAVQEELWESGISFQKYNRWDNFTFWEKAELGFWRLGRIGELFYCRESAPPPPLFFRNRDGLDLLTLVKNWGLDELACVDWIFWVLISERRIRAWS